MPDFTLNTSEKVIAFTDYKTYLNEFFAAML